MKDDNLYLIHISECIDKIQQYTSDGKTAFLNCSKTQDAVIRNFEIIGEAVKRLSDSTRQRTPYIPWRQFAGFRDILIHKYEGVDISEVWQTIESDIPALRKAVKILLDVENAK
ncbi:MAG: DUF86 domain-containing protein [Desulfamplus sp.]|nr:DUF86 domain-containing protein [Desulfamplus sp.]